jgi:hypothetical protein
MKGWRKCGIHTYIYIYVEYYSVIKKEVIVLYSDKWIALEIIMLSKESHSQKDRVECFPSYTYAVHIYIICI